MFEPTKPINQAFFNGIVAPFENWMNILAGKPTMWQNPFDCSESVTGVLRFVCGISEEENHLLGLS